jgi:hypothetical protein
MSAGVLGEPTKIECKKSDLRVRVLPHLISWERAEREEAWSDI